jgi:hypothetical protein
MIAAFCDEKGTTLMGSDGYVHVDGRFTRDNQINEAREYRERFKKHFPHKYDAMTHVMFVRRIRDLPDSYNNRSMPHRYSL